MARFGGNAERYFPLSYEQKALETRAKGRLRRVDAKRDGIEAERDAFAAIERQPVDIAPFLDVVPTMVATPITQAIVAPSPSTVAPRRRVFASDEELAAWALQHPDELTPNQLRVLRDCVSNSTARKVLEMAGIDTEALRTLLRAAA